MKRARLRIALLEAAEEVTDDIEWKSTLLIFNWVTSIIVVTVMDEQRVVVTGLGAVTPIGIGIEEFWEGLKEGAKRRFKDYSFRSL